jgi:hypothetical protein
MTGNTGLARRAEKAAAVDLESLAQAVEKAAEEVLGDDSQALRQARAAVDEIASRLAKELGVSPRTDAEQKPIAPSESLQLAQAGKPQGQQGEGKEGQTGPQGGGKEGQTGPQGEGKEGQTGPQGGGKEGQTGPQGGGKEGQTGPQGGGKEGQTGPQGGGKEEQTGSGGGAKEARGGSRSVAREGNRSGAEGSVRGGDVHGGGDGVPAQELGEWITRLDRVETLLERPHLRAGVARAQRAAEELRADMRRHATKPNSKEIEQSLLQPLLQLRDSISAELARREGRESDVPIDREPVPRKFEQPVKRYYEALGGGR